MAKPGIHIIVGANYSDKDLKRAYADLRRLGPAAKQSQGPMTQLAAGFKKQLTPNLMLAGAAAAAFSVKLGVDAVKAAAAEEAAVARLSQALDNVGQSLELDRLEAYIDGMSRATGVADDQMRPAMITLVNATRDATEAQSLMSLALDISAGSGRDLASVTMALSKAANGQTTALRRLGVPLSDAAIKSGDLNAITAELQQTFQGQAARAANTFQGRLNRLNVAVGELQEAFGEGLMDGLSSFTDSADSTTESIQGLEPIVQATGEAIGQLAGRLGDAAYIIDEYRKKIEGGSGATDDLADSGENAVANFVQLIPIVGSYLTVAGEHAATMRDDAEASQHASVRHEDYKDAVVRARDAAKNSVTYINALGQEVTISGDEAEDAAEKFDLFAAAISKTEQVAAFNKVISEVESAFKKANTPVNTFGEKGEENFDLLKGLIERTASYAESVDSVAGQASIASQGLSSLEDAFANAKMDPATRALLLEPFQALIDDLSEAGVDVGNLQLMLDRLKSKTITVTTEYRFVGSAKPDVVDDPSKDARGGPIYGMGGPRDDLVPVLASPGEFMVQASAASHWGPAAMRDINAGRVPAAWRDGPSATTTMSRTSQVTIGDIIVQGASQSSVESLPRRLRNEMFLAGIEI